MNVKINKLLILLILHLLLELYFEVAITQNYNFKSRINCININSDIIIIKEVFIISAILRKQALGFELDSIILITIFSLPPLSFSSPFLSSLYLK
jgi:hypothetical protein